MPKVRIYPKVYRRDNDKDTWHPETNQDKTFLIQEKLDGSNFSFGIENDVFKIWSRTQTISTTEEFAKTNLDEVRALEPIVREVCKDLGVKTILLSGEILGQAKLKYNKDKKTFKESFYLFDMWASDIGEGNIVDLREQALGKWFNWESLNDVYNAKFSDEFQIIPIIDTLTYQEWYTKEEQMAELYVEKDGNAFESLIMPEEHREGIVVKISGTGMRYKIVSTPFKEKQKLKTTSKKNDVVDRIKEMFITDGRIEKGLQKMALNGVIEGDRKDKRNYKNIAKNSSIIIDDVLEEEIDEILQMLHKELRRDITKKVFKYIENEGIICAVCDEELKKDDLHPEFKTCPKCGKYALKRKVMKWDKEKEEYYLEDQKTGEIFSAVDGKKYKFEEEAE